MDEERDEGQICGEKCGGNSFFAARSNRLTKYAMTRWCYEAISMKNVFTESQPVDEYADI